MTSKEALEDIILYLNANEPKGLYCENIEVIKKELKALEIIKNRCVNVNTLINCIIGALNPLEFYNEKVSENLKLTKQEYELLREVLENE